CYLVVKGGVVFGSGIVHHKNMVQFCLILFKEVFFSLSFLSLQKTLLELNFDLHTHRERERESKKIFRNLLPSRICGWQKWEGKKISGIYLLGATHCSHF
ncbi:hypothetical protein SSS_09652, partial [Sarcoptes scabiei]